MVGRCEKNHRDPYPGYTELGLFLHAENLTTIKPSWRARDRIFCHDWTPLNNLHFIVLLNVFVKAAVELVRVKVISAFAKKN